MTPASQDQETQGQGHLEGDREPEQELREVESRLTEEMNRVKQNLFRRKAIYTSNAKIGIRNVIAILAPLCIIFEDDSNIFWALFSGFVPCYMF